MMRLPKFRYFAPATVTDAVRLKADAGPEGAYVAGGTDLYPNMKRRQQTPKVVVGLSRISSLAGIAHGPDRGTTVCQLHMRRFKDGDTITVEPWRAKAFPVLKDLVVDRSAFDRIIAAGGYVSINVGGAPDGNAIPIPKDVVEVAMDSAACIGCGACVAACKNASAHLFMSAKISHLALLPQGQQERYHRVLSMIDQADSEGFGSCSNEGECEAVCPKEIPISNIARMTREYVRALLGAGK